MQFEKPWEKGTLQVTENGRYFQNGDTPFFWLADTAWMLLQNLSLEDTYRYFRNRKELGYNVIYADLQHRSYQKNLAGESALTDNDFTQINTDGGYWKHIDAVLSMAEELGLYMGILPVWGGHFVQRGILNRENLTGYMKFVIDRYKEYPNIIWILGGDVRGDVNRELFCTMGKMLKEADPDRLVGYHPFGRCDSSLWFHEETWLDFNMFQSGHRRYDQVKLAAWDDNLEKEGCFGEDSWKYVKRDYERPIIKPVLDGEPSYEWIVQGLHDFSQPYWKAADVRRYAYFNVLSGAAGHTYGHNSIMQFYADTSKPGEFGAKYLWEDAIHHPGGAQMSHLKHLMESVDFQNGKPAEGYLLNTQGERYDHISVFAGEEYLIVYTFTGRELVLDLSAYEGKKLAAYWMDPVTGAKTFIRIETKKAASFLPPQREDGSDIVLLLLTEKNSDK